MPGGDASKYSKDHKQQRERANSSSSVATKQQVVTRSASNNAVNSNLVFAAATADGSFNEFFAAFETRIYSRLSEVESRFADKLTEIENKISARIDGIQGILDSFTKRLETFETGLSSLEIKYKQLEERLDFSSSPEGNNKELMDQLENLQRVQRQTDVIIHGVPKSSVDNPARIFNEIANAVKHSSSPYIDAFRLGSSFRAGTAVNSPLLVRFPTKAECVAFISSFRKAGGIKLNQISGFSSDSKVFANYSLTRLNSNILRAAIKLKKAGQLQHVVVRNGYVNVRRSAGDPEFKVTKIEQLQECDDRLTN